MTKDTNLATKDGLWGISRSWLSARAGAANESARHRRALNYCTAAVVNRDWCRNNWKRMGCLQHPPRGRAVAGMEHGLFGVIDVQEIPQVDHARHLLRDAPTLADQGGRRYQTPQVNHPVDGLNVDLVCSECGALREESTHLVGDVGVRGALGRPALAKRGTSR